LTIKNNNYEGLAALSELVRIIATAFFISMPFLLWGLIWSVTDVMWPWQWGTKLGATFAIYSILVPALFILQFWFDRLEKRLNFSKLVNLNEHKQTEKKLFEFLLEHLGQVGTLGLILITSFYFVKLFLGWNGFFAGTAAVLIILGITFSLLILFMKLHTGLSYIVIVRHNRRASIGNAKPSQDRKPSEHRAWELSNRRWPGYLITLLCLLFIDYAALGVAILSVPSAPSPHVIIQSDKK
jgi:MFS family permease